MVDERTQHSSKDAASETNASHAAHRMRLPMCGTTFLFLSIYARVYNHFSSPFSTSMRLPSLKLLAAASAAGTAALLIARILRIRARGSSVIASCLTPMHSVASSQLGHSENCPIFTCDAAAAEERMRRGARSRGEPCVLDVCATNAAEYRRGGCDMIVRDFIEAGASEWAANALRCILVARGADQAFRCRRSLFTPSIRYSHCVQDQNRIGELQEGNAASAALV